MESYEELKKFHEDFNKALKNGDLSKMLDAMIATGEHAVKLQERSNKMTKTKDMIHPVHAEVWYEMATKVNDALKGMDTSGKRPVKDILDDMETRLRKTGYDITSDFTPDQYEYFDFDVFTTDREYGIRIFLGHKWFDEIHVHGLQGMYLYAPSEVDDVLDDVTIDELKEAMEA